MIDYEALRAISAVVETQSFEAAAKSLHITQSAVSQRIASVEAYYGQRLIVRELPYHLTHFGERLVSHLRQVAALESELSSWTTQSAAISPICIAMNRDSLDMWGGQILINPKLKGCLLRFVTNDQALTLDYLRKGQVDLAVSSVSKPLPKCEVQLLGEMTYLLVSTPNFKRAYFSRGVTKAAFRTAPAVIFDSHDSVHASYLERCFRYTEPFPFSWLPSTRIFKDAVLAGFGYGLLPLMDIKEELKQRDLICLETDQKYSLPLYLHNWQIKTKNIESAQEAIVIAAKSIV